MKTECYALLDLPYKRGQTVSVSRNSILALTFAYEGASVVEFRNYHGNRAESIGRLLGNWGDSLAKFEIVMGVGATGLPITANGGDVIADLTLPGMETRDAMNVSPLKNYGFDYEYEGKSFVFHIVAKSEEEARARAKCMGRAAFVGELK